LPGLRRRLRSSRHIFRDRRLSHLKAKHQKLAMDPRRSPQRVFPAYPLDQITQATINSRPSCPISRFPTPKGFKASAMPPQDSFRLNYLGQIKQIGPNPRHPYQQRPVTAAQPDTRRRSPQGDVELMTEKQVLGFEPASRLEYVGDENYKLIQDRKHRHQ